MNLWSVWIPQHEAKWTMYPESRHFYVSSWHNAERRGVLSYNNLQTMVVYSNKQQLFLENTVSTKVKQIVRRLWFSYCRRLERTGCSWKYVMILFVSRRAIVMAMACNVVYSKLHIFKFGFTLIYFASKCCSLRKKKHTLTKIVKWYGTGTA